MPMRYTLHALTLLALAGCSVFDPYLREGTWRPTGAPAANIAAQIARPSDLVRGVDYVPRDSTMATAAVVRYRTGKIKPLPDSGLSGIRLSGSGDAGAAGADAPTAGAAAAAQ